MGIYARLSPVANSEGYVQPLANTTIKHMEMMPPLLNKWQQDDIANDAVGGYYTNPVGNVANSIGSTCISITNIEQLANTSAQTVYNCAVTLITSKNNFYAHTNRLSGLVPVNAATTELPHYSTAMITGKLMMYLTYQSDGVTNNSPIMGNFTSLYTQNTLSDYYTTIQNYPTILAAGMSSTTTEGEGGSTTTWSCNVSGTILTQMATKLTEISSFMDTRRTSDVTFFQTSQAILDDYQEVRGFSGMGQTENQLIKDKVGSEKLLDRLNS